ncbi:MAG TPA: VWA domain-containing protein [Pyrinomonadaceae bacterium]
MKDLPYRQTHPRQLIFALALMFAAFLPAPAQQVETIKVETRLVNLNVVAVDRTGRRLSGLKREDFEVYEDGVRQEITHFATEEEPLRLVLLFDTSISMEAVLPAVRQEAARLVAGLRAQDEISIVTFASRVQMLARWVNKTEAAAEIERLHSEPHTSPVPATIARPGYNVGDGNTYMYEALKYIFENIRGDEDKVAVIMFSDGVDTGAGRSMERIKERADALGKELKWLAQESWALVYPIRYKTRQMIGELPKPAWRPARAIVIGSEPKNPGIEFLEKIAGETGGASFEFQTQQDLAAALEKTFADLRSQYSMAYRPPQRKDEGENVFHRIKVRINRPDAVARTRVGYYGPK